jgi:TatD DNase family protein
VLNPSGIFDTHAHVHDPRFDPDRAVMLERAREAGVGRILTVGCDLADSKRALSTAAEFGLQASIGIHPHEAKDAPSDIAGTFDALAADAPVAPVAIGETGLDYYYTHSPPQAQREVCAAQIRYARARDLPLIFHERNAFEDFSAILRAEFQPQQRGVVHCFTGDTSQARTFVGEFGLVLGIGGVVTFKAAGALREAVRAVGLDRIVLETDCPYLAPVPHRGKRNEPAFIAATAASLAALFEVTVDEVVARTNAVAAALFGP